MDHHVCMIHSSSYLQCWSLFLVKSLHVFTTCKMWYISYFTLFRLQLFQPASITRPCDNTEAFHISFLSDSIPHSMHLNPWFVRKNQLHCLQRNRPFHNSLYMWLWWWFRGCSYYEPCLQIDQCADLFLFHLIADNMGKATAFLWLLFSSVFYLVAGFSLNS